MFILKEKKFYSFKVELVQFGSILLYLNFSIVSSGSI